MTIDREPTPVEDSRQRFHVSAMRARLVLDKYHYTGEHVVGVDEAILFDLSSLISKPFSTESMGDLDAQNPDSAWWGIDILQEAFGLDDPEKAREVGNQIGQVLDQIRGCTKGEISLEDFYAAQEAVRTIWSVTMPQEVVA